MTKKAQRKKLIERVMPKKDLDSNDTALKSYEYYKKTSDLIERVNYALGKKPFYKTGTGSTLNFEIKQHAIYSTTAQKI